MIRKHTKAETAASKTKSAMRVVIYIRVGSTSQLEKPPTMAVYFYPHIKGGMLIPLEEQ